MLIAALDTTTRAGSMALLRDGQVLDLGVGDPARGHAERLPEDLIALMKRHGLRPRDVDLYAVTAGPGSFTGLRIGIATVQGLAFAARRPVVAVSALEALAVAALGPGRLTGDFPVAVWMDAQRGEVFSAVYRRLSPENTAGAPFHEGAAPEVDIVDQAEVASPDDTLDRWRGTPFGDRLRFIGDGAIRYRERILAGFGPGVTIVDPTPPLAAVIGEMAGRRAERGEAVAPHAIRPVYVRRPDAELARDRRARA